MAGSRTDNDLQQNIPKPENSESKRNEGTELPSESDDRQADEESTTTDDIEFDNCWDPFCEKIQDAEVKGESLDELLIDIQNGQILKDINRNDRENGPDKPIVDTYRDDWNVDINQDRKLYSAQRDLRRTSSCPDTPLHKSTISK